MTSRLFASAAVAVFATLGCSSQADTSYRGEPLEVLHGTVLATSGAPPVPVQAALVWYGLMIEDEGVTSSNGSQHVATTAPVVGAFPADFTLQILDPPPSEVFAQCDPADPTSPHLAIAQVTALAVAADTSNVFAHDVYGESAYSIIYVDADLAKPCGLLTPPHLTKGYHLMQRQDAATLAAATKAYNDCIVGQPAGTDRTAVCGDGPSFVIEAPQGFATPISLAVSATPLQDNPAPSTLPPVAAPTPTPSTPAP